MATDRAPNTAANCPSCAHIGRWDGETYVAAAPPVDAGHSPLAHRLYRVCANGGITSRAQLAALTDAEFLDLRGAGTGTLALLRRYFPAPGTDTGVVRAALAELQSAGLKDLRPGSPAVAVRCDVIKRIGPRAAQSLLFLQRILHDYGERLAANLGPRAVDDLTDSLIRAIAAVAAPEEGFFNGD